MTGLCLFALLGAFAAGALATLVAIAAAERVCDHLDGGSRPR